MPVTALSVDSELLSATAITAAEKARDLNHVATPLLAEQARVHGPGNPNKGSGFRWVQGMGTGVHSNPTRRRTGFEQIDLSLQGVLTPIVLQPAEVVFPVGISDLEEDLNGGEDQIIELAAKRTSQVMSNAKRQWERQSLQGGVARFEDFLNLNGTDNTDGIVEEDAPPGQANVIGGFSKATFSALPGAQNQAFDGAASANTRLLAGLYQLSVRTRARAEEEMGWAAIFSQAALEHFKRTTQANERYMVTGGKDTPLDPTGLHLMVQGVRAHASTLMPNAGANTTANPWSVLLLDLLSIYFMWSKTAMRDGYFGFEEFETIGGDYDARVAKVLVRGQWWVEGWGTTGLLVDADTF